MSPLGKAVRQTLTIARRDFTATVYTPVFLLFLFAPFLMGALSAVAGFGAAASVDRGASDRARLVAIVAAADTRPIAEADTRLRGVFRQGEGPAGLTTLAPARDPAAQARAAFAARDYDAAAVMYGPLAAPTILEGPRGGRAGAYLATLAAETLADEALGANRPRIAARHLSFHTERRTRRDTGGSAFFATFGIFFLTLFLAGQVASSMTEERNNKVVEILAAAVPLETVFVGKLLGMLGVAILFVAFWATVLFAIGPLMPPGLRAGLAALTPAIGLPTFTVLFGAYFVMAFLLLGSVFLGIGAQATSPRETQMLSLPITVIQVAMFGLASAGSAVPGSTLARVAEIFPLSSPFAMAGHAATQPGLAVHALALAWQALWVALFVAVGAWLFRRGVLQSGGRRTARRRQAIDTAGDTARDTAGDDRGGLGG